MSQSSHTPGLRVPLWGVAIEAKDTYRGGLPGSLGRELFTRGLA